MTDTTSHAASAEGATGPGAGGMQAAQVVAPGQVEMRTLPLPEPGPGEVRARIEGCGVCASNLEPWAGPEWQEFPMEPGGMGHEAWGVVEALGADVRGLAVGDHIGWLGSHGYASHEVLPAAAALILPPALAGRPFPAEPLGCAMNIFRRSGIEAGRTVAIIGIGFIGATLTALAARAGARVIAISRRDSSLELARQMGTAETIPMHDHWEIMREVGRLTGDRLCDVVIEAVGLQWPLDLAGELVREGGRLVVAGYHQDGPRQVNMQMWNWKGIDIVSAHERDPEVQMRGMREAVDAVADGRVDLAPLLTHRFPLSELGRALDATRDKPDGLVKAWVQP
ncbi:putative oxidoreductase protein [Oceanicola granulosus HTCC2516]|uniref:Putative oxidoreductase protein n=1 Tax=Oceanicola granulosus (strain ATCC BAA-861 / DSM 15982 / KCTC 12143 / HTCC2516) TaxID=314256 RepID=Q2CJL0_OCEGH|nr:zinc-binding dehydrogenase [Oceanicola granulosus]EAR53129.1 putative oxidoreductase protein [Oceanicola granulosus HTCC2516]